MKLAFNPSIHMEKKIEDYLHLYLGCEVLINSGDIHNEKLIIDYDFLNTYYEVEGGYFMNNPIPLLRPLSSMTEEEAKEMDMQDVQISMIAHPSFMPVDIYFNAKQMRILLEKGFDLWSLIDAGLALDATKIE